MLDCAGLSEIECLARSARSRTQSAKGDESLPSVGYATLSRQLNGATESVAFNIVEGCGASTQKEFARFLDISIKSSSEAEYQLQLACDYGVLPESNWKTLSSKTVTIRRMLCRLRQRVIESLEDPE